ncbi:MAG TPA: hypothetical protein P5295_16470 [Spirochaetota bacterium]|nr:hypothetical protein [Spirochaetota bacterium]
MKKIFLFMLLIFVPAIVINSCDDGNGNGGGSSITDSPAGTFTRLFEDAAGSGNASPFWGGTDVKAQYLYTSDEISGNGLITAIRLQLSSATTTDRYCPNVTIKMGHTSLTALTNTWANNVQIGQGAEITILDNKTIEVPISDAGSWIDIPLDTPFYYNGVENLVVDFEKTSGCSANIMTTNAPGTSRRALSTAPDNSPGVAEYNTTTSSTPDGSHPWMQFVFSGGENTQNYGGTSNNSWPFSSSAPLRTQNLYLASDINGSGSITGIAFQLNTVSSAGSFTYTLKFSHATVNTLNETFSSNYSDTAVTAADSVTFTVPGDIPAGDWFWVPIPDDTFIYNGNDNLILEVATTSGTAFENLRVSARTGARVWANGATTTIGTVDTCVYHIKLRFHGGTLDVISDSTESSTKIFNTTLSGIMGLYHASELGASGTITSVYCRLNDAASTAASYDRFRLIIGHSSGTRLVTTPSDNFIAQHSAVNGTVSVPAGLIAGDWIEIPLAAPFEYNGTDNLVVWMGTYAASGAGVKHGCRLSSVQSQYTENLAYGLPGNSAVSAPVNQKLDLRLKIVK